MAPNFNYNKAISNWKRKVTNGSINVAPRYTPSIQEQMKMLTPNNYHKIEEQERALSKAIHNNTRFNSNTKLFHSKSMPGYISTNVRNGYSRNIETRRRNNEARHLKEAANRMKNQLNKLRGIKRHTEGSLRKSRKTRKNRR